MYSRTRDIFELKPIVKKSFSRPDKYKDAMQNFFKKIVAAIDLHLDLEKLKCVLIASPGFVRDEFLQYILEPKEQNKKFTTNREKFVSGRVFLLWSKNLN